MKSPLVFLLLFITACVVGLIGCAGFGHGTEPPPNMFHPHYNPNTGQLWPYPPDVMMASLGMVQTNILGTEVWYSPKVVTLTPNPRSLPSTNAEVHTRDYWVGYIAGEAEARAVLDRSLRHRTNSVIYPK